MLEGIDEMKGKQLPVKTAYWLRRAKQAILSALTPFEEIRKELVEKHARKDEEGKPILIEGTNVYDIVDMDAFNAEFVEIAQVEVEVKYKPMPIEAFGDVTASEEEIEKLGRLIKDEDEEKADEPIAKVLPEPESIPEA